MAGDSRDRSGTWPDAIKTRLGQYAASPVGDRPENRIERQKQAWKHKISIPHSVQSPLAREASRILSACPEDGQHILFPEQFG